MNEGEVRYRYRYPVWLGLIAVPLAYVMWIAGAPAPPVFRALIWLVSAGTALVAVATVASHVRRVDVVLTEHAITGAAPLRRRARIDFATVEKLTYQDIWSPAGRRYSIFEIRAPGRKLVLWDRAFRDRETFDQVIATVAQRVAAHGGPGIPGSGGPEVNPPFIA